MTRGNGLDPTIASPSIVEASAEGLVHGVSHVEVPVARLPRSRPLYMEGLGFAVRREGEDWVDLDGSSLRVRLVEVGRPEHRTLLRIQVSDVEAVYRHLLTRGARSLYAPVRTPAQELVATVADPDGHRLTLWRELTEDEYGFLPALPTEQTWRPAAEALLKSLLVAVPALFRALARRKVVRLAEELAAGRSIEEQDVVRAYILASAKITRYRLIEPLRLHGYDPEAFRAEFEAE